MTNEVKILLGVGLVTLLILIGGAFFISGTSSTPEAENETKQVNAELLVRPDSFSTNPSAKILVVEFGDYQCPACGSAHPTTVKIIENYNDDVNFVFRHYPLPQHKNAKIAAYAAEAAGLQGSDKFWLMHDKLYENQQEWSEENDAKKYFEKYASEIGLNIEKFKEDSNSNEVKDKVERDKADGNSLGISSTPTFFINGYQYSGALNYTQFEEAIKKHGAENNMTTSDSSSSEGAMMDSDSTTSDTEK